MKKAFFLVLTCLSGMMFQSCGSSDSHTLYISYPFAEAKYLYADGVEDSIRFLTTDSWKMQTDNNWMTFRNGQNTIEQSVVHYENAIYEFTETINFLPNNTGKRREGYVNVMSHEYLCTAIYRQRPIFDFSHPSPFEIWEPTDYTLALQDSAHVVEDSVCFRVRKPWQMEIVPSNDATDWITITPNSGGSGPAKVTVLLTPNTTGNQREAKLKLISSGVENVITVTQLGK